MFLKIGSISRRYRHIKRYRQIVSVLLKHGLGDLVTRAELYRQLGISRRFFTMRKAEASLTPLTRWQRFRMVLEELGPSFIKLGQLASTRPDLVPPEACAEFEKLQDTVPAFPVSHARQIIETELGKPLEVLFKDFDETPVASASVSQVHRAVLPDGTVTAIKVQRPGIRATIEVDLEIMFDLAELIEKHIQGMETLDPTGIVQEFSRTIKRELDFDIEAGNIERFARNFQSDTTTYVPKVYRHLSTDKVLVMEYVEGIKVSDLDALTDANLDLELIANRGADIILKQIFEHGFFHADPHPGNILVLPDNVVCLLDYGMTGTLTGRTREQLGNLIYGIVRRDAKRMTRSLLSLSQREGTEAVESLEADIADFVEQHLYRPLKDMHIGSLLTQLVQLLMHHNLQLPPVLYLLDKALITVEGNGRRLSPEFDSIEHMKPFVRQLLSERLSIRKLRKDFYATSLDWEAVLRELPANTRNIIDKIKRGKIRIEFEHKGLEPMLRTHDRISNRLVYGIVLSSLVIGSSLIVLSGIPPKWHEIPIIGIIGFLTAGAMGFWLLVSILKHGKM
ncbi:MAG: AarF/ABC1/UbiB kinase family protein [candidate division Zixibacteria bacterium]|nr:AarF/ABC1/UbiB kinase family protein [candidate division Zixibacteria bacterium]